MARLDEVLGSKKGTQAKSAVNDLFTGEDSTRWDRFSENVADKKYLTALRKDPRSDAKLRLHADMLNKLARGKPVASMLGHRGNYEVRKLPGTKRLGCTCNDWRYRRSISTVPFEQDCKHIKRLKEQKMEKIAQFLFFFESLY